MYIYIYIELTHQSEVETSSSSPSSKVLERANRHCQKLSWPKLIRAHKCSTAAASRIHACAFSRKTTGTVLST